MTRAQYDELSEPLLRVLADMEDDILRLVAAQLARDGNFSDTSKWRIRQLARAGRLDKEVAALIVSYTGVQTAEMQEAVNAAALTEIGYLDKAVQDSARKGFFGGSTDIPAEESAMGAAKAFKKQAQSDLNLVNTVMRYKAKSAYVKAVNAAYRESQKSRQDVLDVMGKSAAKTVMGHMSLQEATRKTIKELAEKGIPAFVDKSGREWSPEAYIMMDMRSTLGNTARAAQDTRCDEYGINLIEVSSHMGARPLCAPYQGRIFSRDGTSGVTTDGAGNKISYTPLSQTSYGQPAGLFGINCGHVQYPFAAGCSFQTYFPYPKEENAERYKQFQRQRAMERDIRAAKRECMMLNETGDKEGFEKASVRLKAQKKKYSDYCRETGLKQHNDRTQVYGFDRSVSSKAVWAERKAQTASGGSAPVSGGSSGGNIQNNPNSGLTSSVGSGKIEEKTHEYSEQAKNIIKNCESEKIVHNEVRTLDSILNSDEIWQKISGGDKTDGSCSSAAFAYIGNKCGYDVLDFRGGKSQEFFAQDSNIKMIAELPGVNKITFTDKKEIKAGINLLNDLDLGKEYYFSIGKHSAIVRRTIYGAEYLELQSEKQSGWQKFDGGRYGTMANTLLKRFGCRKTVDRSFGKVWDQEAYAMEVDSFKNNEDFKHILGYLNTSISNQKKGVSGNVK